MLFLTGRMLAQHLYPGLQLQSVGAGGLYPAAFRSLDTGCKSTAAAGPADGQEAS